MGREKGGVDPPQRLSQRLIMVEAKKMIDGHGLGKEEEAERKWEGENGGRERLTEFESDKGEEAIEGGRKEGDKVGIETRKKRERGRKEGLREEYRERERKSYKGSYGGEVLVLFKKCMN